MRSFAGYPTKPYNGVPFAVPAQLCGGTFIPFLINWFSYGASTVLPNLGINIDFKQNSPSQSTLKKVTAMYIDNLASPVPIYVYFGDTQQTIVCQPFSSAWSPILTNQQACTVYGLGFVTGFIPTTLIYLTDVFIPPYLNPETQITFPQSIGSPVIQRTNTITPGFGPPALGDQAIGILHSWSDGGGFPLNFIDLPAQANGFYYLTSFNIFVANVDTAWSVSGGHGSLFIGGFYDLTNLQVIIPFQFKLQSIGAVFSITDTNFVFLNSSGFNFRLDATHNYGFRLVSFTDISNPISGVVTGWDLVLAGFIAYTFNTN